MGFLELFTGGTLGTALGAVGALTEKFITQRMANAEKERERDHIRQMFDLQMQADAKQHEQELSITTTEGDYKTFDSSIQHDMGLHKDTSKWVRNVLSFFRPLLCVTLIYVAMQDPQFVTLAAMSVGWFFGSRSGHIGPQK